MAIARVPLPKPSARTECWSMDFVSDALFDGRPFRCVKLVDDFTRECVAIEVAHSLPAWRVIHVLERAATERGLPRSIVCDNGPEFAGKAMIAGRTSTASCCNPFVLASPSRMRTAKASTANDATSV